MKIIEALKKTDRTILEMHLGQLFFGVVCQLIGSFFTKGQGWYTASLWLGIVFSMAAVIHMGRTLDRAFKLGEGAEKVITRGYMFRYAVVVLLLIASALTKTLNPLVVFLGYMSLKGTAYLQPFTHKLLNRLFHETDPVPEPIQEQDTDLSEGQASSPADSRS